MKGIKAANRKEEGFAQFQEEEKENENNYDHNFKRLSNGSSLGSSSCKTIHRSLSDKSNKNVILKMNEMIRDYPEKYYKQYLKSDIIKLIKNLFILLIHIIIIVIYLNSIHSCPKKLSLNECIEKLNMSHYYKITFECFICGVLMSLILILILVRAIYLFQIFIIIDELIIFICLSHKNDIYNNGLFSFQLLIEFMSISFTFLLFFSLFLIRLKKKDYFYSTFFFLLFISCNYLFIILFTKIKL